MGYESSKRLLEYGTLLEIGEVLEFTAEQLFNAPSTAAAVVLARRANGWTEWKDKDGVTWGKLKRK